MQIKLLKIFTFLIAITVFLAGSADVNAQKRKKKKGKKEKVEKPAEITADAKRKAEAYHAEAEKYFILEDYAKAFVLYQKALEFDPHDAAAHFRIAKIYLNGNEVEKAIFNAKRAIELDETNKFYYLLLAEIYKGKSNFAEAAAVYETMISKCKKADEYLFELAAMYVYQEKYEEALKVYDRIEERFGINEQVIAQKQKLYLKLSNLDKAIAEGQKLIDAFPGESRYVLMQAEILLSNNQAEKAIEYLQNLIDEYPDNPRALLMLAEIYRRKGDAEKSNIYLNKAFGMSDLNIELKIRVLADFIQKFPNKDLEKLAMDLGDKMLKTHPDDARAYEINGDIYLRTGHDEKALELYKKALDLGSGNYNTWQNALQLEMKMEKYKDAITDGEKALELFPNQPGICWFLGTAYLIEKEDEKAIQILEMGKKLTGNNDELKALFNAQLGDAYNNVKDYEKSDEAYEAALAFNPNNDHVLNNYSYFLSLRKEKLDLALKMSTKLVSRNPDDPTYLDTHAWVLYMLGKYEEALKYIEKAIAADDVSGTIIEHYGDILFKLGKVDEAVTQWKKAKGMDETSELIDKKIADRKLYE